MDVREKSWLVVSWALITFLGAACGKTPEVLVDVFDKSAFAAEAALRMQAAQIPSAHAPVPELGCPPDMVRVKKSYCVDRYESSLVDADTERPLSIFYPPLPSYDRYLKERQAEGDRLLLPGLASEKPELVGYPPLPEWQRRGQFKAKAISRKGVLPNAYLALPSSTSACALAGKRLCSLEEWQTACRGEQNRPFPYGDTYKQGVCNVFREDHPGHILFNNMSVGMIDPRMNKVTVKGKPLLRKTGATPECKSEWEGDAIYDMVGNLDEWVDDPEGTFAGGFYSRTAKNGCDKVIRAHTPSYYDYSTGGRCCRDLMAMPSDGAASPTKQKEPDGSPAPSISSEQKSPASSIP